VLQCIAVCSSVLQFVAVSCIDTLLHNPFEAVSCKKDDHDSFICDTHDDSVVCDTHGSFICDTTRTAHSYVTHHARLIHM